MAFTSFTNDLLLRQALEMPAESKAHALLEEQASKTVESLIDQSASRYALYPSLLEFIESGLSSLRPHRMAARIDELIVQHIRGPRRMIPIVNLRAAQRYAARLIKMERPAS